MNLRTVRRTAIFSWVWLCAVLCADAQVLLPHPNGGRRRVGVALSGGSALGLAQIGVIRYFEEHHIPIDDIAGTSMGGLVGGFYAIGMDSGELTQLVDKADWDALLSSMPRFLDQPAVDKQRWYRPFGNLSLRFGRHFSLPAGLNPGMSLSLFLSRNTLAYSNVSDFGDLPTPFRCVATDLVSGEGVVLKQGVLARALRATMALPGVFTPVTLDGMVLVDGGMVENIPVDVVRDMGAQFVIAVALETPRVKAERLKTVGEVLRHTIEVVVSQNEQRSLAHADLVISVDTAKFSRWDYQRSNDIIQAGYEAAQEKAADLKRFELPAEEWDRFLALRRQKIRPARSRGAVVQVSAPNASFEKKASGEVQRKLGSRIVDVRELDDVLTGMAAAAAVPGATYAWRKTEDGREGFQVDFAGRPGDQVLVEPSFLYSVSPQEPTRAALKFSTATIFENAYKSRLLTTLNIGYDPGMRAEYYHPFGGSPYFIAPGLFVERYNVNRYGGNFHTADTRDRFGASFYAGMGTWRFLQARFGLEAGYDSYGRAPTVDRIPPRSSGFLTPQLRWLYNSENSGGLPTRGTHAEGSMGYSFRNVSYPFFENQFSTFHPLGRKLTGFAISQIGTSFGRKLDYFEQFLAGGPGALTAFRYQEFHANTMLVGGAGLTYRAPSVESLGLHPRLAAWYEAARLDLGSQGWTTHQSTSAGVFVPTPVGAAGVALSFDETGKARFRLLFGRPW